MRGMDIQTRIQGIIDQRRQQLTKERDEYKQKMRDTEAYWGLNGPYKRQEAAMECREKQLKELDDFEVQLKRTTKHIEPLVYIFACRECGAVCMTTKEPFSDWHECPTCRKMIRLENVPSRRIKIAEDGSGWQAMIKEALKEE